jgi:hypothetical protein
MKTIVLVFFIILSLSFAVSYFSVLFKLKKSNLALIENYIAKEAALGALLKTKDSSSSVDNEMHKENFIKFLSDSRDWAFDYIEEVQSELEKFIKEIEPEIEYFDEHAVVGSEHPNYYSMKKISKAYKDLKKLLPEGIN